MPKPMIPPRRLNLQIWRPYSVPNSQVDEKETLEALLQENERLRAENERLRTAQRLSRPLNERHVLVWGAMLLCFMALVFACLALYLRG
ncbi:MAG TPA: hypothetical protein VKV18_03045 [Chthonomonas sp.]|nr:hypothetical protein [Chthonomonas sp.]